VITQRLFFAFSSLFNQTMASSAVQAPGMRPAPTRSRILSKFGKAKAMNPFAEEEKRAVQNMTEGTAVRESPLFPLFFG
jgi:hypothetical protein